MSYYNSEDEYEPNSPSPRSPPESPRSPPESPPDSPLPYEPNDEDDDNEYFEITPVPLEESPPNSPMNQIRAIDIDRLSPADIEEYQCDSCYQTFTNVCNYHSHHCW
jgi:hypothetical protein